jgi:hypothetical protein
MAMSTLQIAATALSGLNSLLLVALLVVWLRNYRTFASPMTLGLATFAVVLLIENLVAIAFFFSTTALYAMSPAAGATVAAMRALQFVALGVLTYVTLQ